MSEKTKITVTYELTGEESTTLLRQVSWFNRLFGENFTPEQYFAWIMEAESGFKFTFDCAIRRMDGLLRTAPERNIHNERP